MTAEPTLSELMNTDPLLLTADNRRAIITAYRDLRHRYNQGDMQAGSIKAKAKPKALRNADDLKDLGDLKL